MTEEDKKARVGDCHFIILTKLPSGHIHLVNIPSRDIKNWMIAKNDPFNVMENNIKEIDFTPVL